MGVVRFKSLVDLINLHKTKVYIIILVCIAVLTHLNWFNPFSVFSYADLRFVYDELATSYPSSYATWLSYKSWGLSNIQLYFYPFNFIWALTAEAGLGFMQGIKITHFIPIAILSVLSPFILFKYLSGSGLGAFLGSLVFSFSTHMIWREQQHYTIAAAFAIGPLVVWAFITAIRTRPKLFNLTWLRLALLFTLSLLYEPRITYITTIVLFLIFCYMAITYRLHFLKGFILPAIIFSVIVLFLNLYWIIPTLFGASSGDLANVASRETIADYQYSLLQAFSISDHSWTLTGLTTGTTQPVLVYLWILPLLAILSLILCVRNKVFHKASILFALTALIGIFITKQNSAPLVNSFELLRSYLPGFYVFRTASPFYYLTMLGFSGLISLLIPSLQRFDKKFKRRRRYLLAAISLILILVGLNLIPVLKGDIKGNLVNYDIPAAYINEKDNLKNDKEFYRTLWYPIKSRWAHTDTNHPAIDAREIFNVDSNSPVPEIVGKTSVQDGIDSVWSKDSTGYLLSAWSVKYVFVPLSDSNVDYPDNYVKFNTTLDTIRSKLDAVPYLKRVDSGDKSLIKYENLNYRPRVLANLPIYNVPSNEFNVDAVLGYLHKIQPNMEVIKSSGPDENNSVKSIFNNSPTHSITNANNQLAIDTGMGKLAYRFSDRLITFYIKESSNIDKKNLTISEAEVRQLAKIDIENDTDYTLNYNGQLIRLVNDDKVNIISDININKVDQLNIIKSKNESSSRASPYADYVSSCSKEQSQGAIKREIYNGKSMYKLSSSNGIACVKTTIIKKFKGPAIFNLPYMSTNDTSAGYSVVPVNNKSKSIYEKLYSANDTLDYNKLIDLNDYIGPIDIYVYDYDPSAGNKELRYGLPQLSVVSETFALNISKNKERFKIIENIDKGELTLAGGEVEIKNVNPSIANGSFEDGTWSKNVSDCNNYDDQPFINQYLSDDASEGEKSMRIDARRHTACTVKAVSIEPGTYKIKFDYKSDTKFQGYFISQSFSDGSVSNNNYSIGSSEGDWKVVEKEISVESKSNIRIGLYVNESDGKKTNSSLFDNVRIIKIPSYTGKYILTENKIYQSNNVIRPDSVADRNTVVDASFNTCKISNVVYSNRYSKGWALKSSQFQEPVYEGERTLSGMSLWIKDKKYDKCEGSENLSINFSAQSKFVVGGILSLATIVIITLFTVKKYIKRHD